MSIEQRQPNAVARLREEDVTESETRVWPPPPDTPDPLTEYGDFLTDLVCGPMKKSQPPSSRIRLAHTLRRHTGMQLHVCRDVVNSFCDSYGIFPKPRGLWVRVSNIIGITMIVLGFLQIGFALIFAWFLEYAHTHAQRAAMSDLVYDMNVVLGCLFVMAIFMFAIACSLKRHTYHMAEEAKRRLSS